MQDEGKGDARDTAGAVPERNSDRARQYTPWRSVPSGALK